MTIYLDISAAVHHRTGLGRYAESLTRALVTADPGRYALFYNRERSAKPLTGLEHLPTHTISLGYKPWRMAVWLGQLAHIGFDKLLPGAELFHATEHLLMPLHHTPCVLTIHDLAFRIFPHCHKPLNYAFLNLAMPLFIRRANSIIAVSRSTKQDLVRLYGVDPNRIKVIYEAADHQFQPQPMETIEHMRRKYSLTEPFVLCVSTIEPRKNLIRLLEAWQMVIRKPKHPGVRLVIVGKKGWLYQPFFRRLEELGLDRKVILLGHVPDVDLPALYSAAMLFVFPSLYEGFGLPPLEAMACGVPVICSNASSLPEVTGDAALLVDPLDVEALAEAMDRVLTDEALRAGMRERGLRQAAKFSWEDAARRTSQVYESLAR